MKFKKSLGIIPRAVKHLFNGVNSRKQKAAEENLPPPEYQITAQFLELYNEEIIDLLSATRNADPKACSIYYYIRHSSSCFGLCLQTYLSVVEPSLFTSDCICSNY